MSESEHIRTNVMWVAAQVLKHADPNLDLHEFAVACGVPHRITHNKNGAESGGITAGIRIDGETGLAAPPGGPHSQEQPTIGLAKEVD
ncbi:hypothetical protein [Nesterenkonia halotolerans]|uniref:hypothetical protein n=1 Tax=Nesterenkonia halotolerans TaxID=225325 RepID=UPI00362E4FEF